MDFVVYLHALWGVQGVMRHDLERQSGVGPASMVSSRTLLYVDACSNQGTPNFKQEEEF
jgi:hypothetical protein